MANQPPGGAQETAPESVQEPVQEPEGQFYVLAASVLALLIGTGAMYLIVVALKPIAAEFGPTMMRKTSTAPSTSVPSSRMGRSSRTWKRSGRTSSCSRAM